MTYDRLFFKSPRRLWAAMVLVLAGCGGGTSEKSYHPPVASARDALTVALNAWKEGQSQPGKIEATNPAVQVADAAWSAGKKLKNFEILKDEQIPDGPQKFTVTLTLDGAPQPQEVVYVIVGKDPLWIFREEEYRRGLGM